MKWYYLLLTSQEQLLKFLVYAVYVDDMWTMTVTGQVADWTTRGLADAAKRTKTKHAKSPVAFASCPVRELAYPRVVQ